jgi:hypothetical protein
VRRFVRGFELPVFGALPQSLPPESAPVDGPSDIESRSKGEFLPGDTSMRIAIFGSGGDSPPPAGRKWLLQKKRFTRGVFFV